MMLSMTKNPASPHGYSYIINGRSQNPYQFWSSSSKSLIQQYLDDSGKIYPQLRFGGGLCPSGSHGVQYWQPPYGSFYKLEVWLWGPYMRDPIIMGPYYGPKFLKTPVSTLLSLHYVGGHGYIHQTQVKPGSCTIQESVFRPPQPLVSSWRAGLLDHEQQAVVPKPARSPIPPN